MSIYIYIYIYIYILYIYIYILYIYNIIVYYNNGIIVQYNSIYNINILYSALYIKNSRLSVSIIVKCSITYTLPLTAVSSKWFAVCVSLCFAGTVRQSITRALADRGHTRQQEVPYR